MADEVIPFSRFRAALARAKKTRKTDALLADPEARALIPKLPVQELYYAIKETGLSDAHEIVALASPEQVRGFVDLDVWERDRVDVDKLRPWLEALVDAGPEKLLRAIDVVDPEVVALYLQRQVRVYDLGSDEPVPDEPEGHFYPTPDNFFLLDVLPAGEVGKSIERMIDWLYRADLEKARRIVMSAKWELDSDLEEWAYRWRSGRMSDLGYAEYYEALSIYQWIDPQSVKLEEEPPATPAPIDDTALPVQLASAIDAKSFFGRAVQGIKDEASLDRVEALLMLLVNKAMAADRVEPGDLEAAKRTLDRSVATLGVGLEFLAKGDVERAARALGRVGLERIFRVGFSLGLQLRTLAQTFAREAIFANWLDPPFDALLAALTVPRPAFGSLEDLGRAARALDEAATMGRAVTGALALTRETLGEIRKTAVTPPERPTLGALVRTAAAQVMLGRPPTGKPLHPRDLHGLTLVDGRPPSDARARIDAQFPALAPWLDAWLSEMNKPGALLLRYSWLK